MSLHFLECDRQRNTSRQAKHTLQNNRESTSAVERTVAKPNDRGELLLVEGKSAFDALSQVRQRATQAVLALQGKVPNALTRSEQQITSHVQCHQLISTLGCGHGEQCDPAKMRYSRVLILTDPDNDGAHSRYLLWQLFRHYLQPLVQQDLLGVVLCPRYRIARPGFDTPTYCWSEEEKENLLKFHCSSDPAFAGAIDLTCFKGLASLAPHELSHWLISAENRRQIGGYADDPLRSQSTKSRENQIPHSLGTDAGRRPSTGTS